MYMCPTCIWCIDVGGQECHALAIGCKREAHCMAFSWPADNTIPCLIFHMLLSEAFIAEVLAPQFTFRAVHCT